MGTHVKARHIDTHGTTTDLSALYGAQPDIPVKAIPLGRTSTGASATACDERVLLKLFCCEHLRVIHASIYLSRFVYWGEERNENDVNEDVFQPRERKLFGSFVVHILLFPGVRTPHVSGVYTSFLLKLKQDQSSPLR